MIVNGATKEEARRSSTASVGRHMMNHSKASCASCPWTSNEQVLIYLFFCTLSRFYIGCDRCQNWYHGRCVGILQSEANHIDVYVCPQCQSTEDAMTVLTPLTDKDYEGLKRILRSLQVCGLLRTAFADYK